MNDPAGLVDYLLAEGVVSPESIVNGTLIVAPITRRNASFKVIASPGRSYIVKAGAVADGVATISHEAAVYDWLQGGSALAFERHMPRRIRWIEAQRLLILELVEG